MARRTLGISDKIINLNVTMVRRRVRMMLMRSAMASGGIEKVMGVRLTIQNIRNTTL